jgi:hypothetical protein
MRYTFIIYETLMNSKPKQFEMVLIENASDVYAVTKRVLGPSAAANVFHPHAFDGCKMLPNGEIIPSPTQQFYNPLTLVNKAFFHLMKEVRNKKFIMNEKGGHQPLLENMDEIGWKEIRREKRETLSFHQYA